MQQPNNTDTQYGSGIDELKQSASSPDEISILKSIEELVADLQNHLENPQYDSLNYMEKHVSMLLDSMESKHVNFPPKLIEKKFKIILVTADKFIQRGRNELAYECYHRVIELFNRLNSNFLVDIKSEYLTKMGILIGKDSSNANQLIEKLKKLIAGSKTNKQNLENRKYLTNLEAEFFCQIAFNLLLNHYSSSYTILTERVENKLQQEKHQKLKATILTVLDYLFQFYEPKIVSMITNFILRLSKKAARLTDEVKLYEQLLIKYDQATKHDQNIKKLFSTENKTTEKFLNNYYQQIETFRDKYLKKLKDARQDLNHTLTKKDTNNIEGVDNYTDAIKKLITSMMEDCERFLGPVPEELKFCFISLGSTSREELLPYSDLECICLVKNREHSDWESPKASLANRYLSTFYKYFQFKMISLGESFGKE